MKYLTGIQASGTLHIGNYFGSIKQILDLQENKKDGDEIFLMLATLHSLTTIKDPIILKEHTKNAILDHLALGIDPDKIIFYNQLDIPETLELFWILSNLSGMGALGQAHSYKDKTAKGISANLGLFSYPVLMAADILIANSDVIPVGKDQIQHVEMARDIAKKFNNHYGETFTIPDVKINKETQIIPGTDGEKMSKSYGNTIPIFGSKKEIKKAVMGISTDSKTVEERKNPKECNVFQIFKLFGNEKEIADLEEKYLAGNFGYGDSKKLLLKKIEEKFGKASEKRAELEKNPKLLDEIMEKGKMKMKKYSEKMIEKVRKKVGLR